MAGTCCCNTKSLFCTAFYPKYFAVGVNRVNTTIDAISLKRRMDFAMSINFVRILKHLGDFILPLGLFVLRYRRLCILTIFPFILYLLYRSATRNFQYVAHLRNGMRVFVLNTPGILYRDSLALCYGNVAPPLFLRFHFPLVILQTLF